MDMIEIGFSFPRWSGCDGVMGMVNVGKYYSGWSVCDGLMGMMKTSKSVLRDRVDVLA